MSQTAQPATGAQHQQPVDWHALPVDQVLPRAQSTPTGLSSAEAQARLASVGPNQLPEARGESIWRLLARQIHHPLIYVLLASSVLAILMGKTLDGLVVLGVVVLNTLIGFVQEYRAGQAIKALMGMVPSLATVWRDGQKTTLPAAELVPGDLVALQSGDKVPADLRLFSERDLRIDEAALTGESLPVEKDPGALPAQMPLADRTNMAYSGTLVSYGVGTGLVVATGEQTELGRISSMLSQTTDLQTPLTRQMQTVAKGLTVGILAVSVVLLGLGLYRGYSLADAVLAAIALAVAAIPEGLPAIITIALAIGVHRMAQRRALIRKLPAVETLGSTTVICTDKTGTLTRNEMTVQALWTGQGPTYRLSGVGYAPKGQVMRDGQQEPVESMPEDVAQLLRAGALCSDAALQHEQGVWSISGDPTEGALVVAAEKAGLGVEAMRSQYPRLDAIPFESHRQFMATLHRNASEGGDGAGGVIYLKGAPEVVLARCKQGGDGQATHLAEAPRRVEQMAADGLRVLALACKAVASDHTALSEADVEGGFRFLGLAGMIDPPRPEAIEAVAACQRAGITVKMITGDHKGTAEAIGRQIGLLKDGEAGLAGAELAGLADERLRELAMSRNVFARVAPEHKLRLVRALQAEGEVVAMTGDGVNDAPALKQANIGTAMGITGTAVSKEAADIVLADDNFASIVAAVEEGRRVYDNLIKALAFVLPTNLGLALILMVAVAFFPESAGGAPLLPMAPVQILWINLVATVTLALPLAFEAMEPDVMNRPPRHPKAPVLGTFVLLRTLIVGLLMAGGATGLFLYEYHLERSRLGHAVAVAEAQTMAVTTVILFQIFYLLNCRSLKDTILRIGLWSNPKVYVGIAAILLLQLGFMYLPFMQRLFGSWGLDAEAWVKSLVVAAVVLPVISAEKWWHARRRDAS